MPTVPGRTPALLLAASLVLAACGAEAPSGTVGGATLEPSASTPAAVVTAAPTLEPGATLPAESAIPATEEPSVGPGGAIVPVAADACSGSDDNRSFFALAAESLSWQVYCAALPEGWLVQSGSYQLAGGGRLKVAYAGPGGTRFELRQGAVCAEDSACVPSGDDIALVPFGDREARLLAWDGGGYAAMVDGGAPLSWVAYGTGLDETAFRALVAGLLPVAAAP